MLREMIVETSLRKFSVYRKLTAFKTGSYTAAGACVLTLMSASAGFSVTAAGASALSEIRAGAAFSRGKLMKLNNLSS